MQAEFSAFFQHLGLLKEALSGKLVEEESQLYSVIEQASELVKLSQNAETLIQDITQKI